MGIGGKKSKNQLRGSRMDDAYRQAIQQRMGNGSANEADDEKKFRDGFKKGLGLKEGEEVGQEGVKGGLRDMVFAAQDTAMHGPGLDSAKPKSLEQIRKYIEVRQNAVVKIGQQQ